MQKPNPHPFEEARIEALKSLKILDTVNEQEYDDITFIAAEICKTPIALISLIDETRQWFKSKKGLEATETPKENAFCAHAILQKDIFVVPNSAQDERFFDNPLVTGQPNVKFYAGAPLLDPKTHLPIGTLCVIDHCPRNLEPSQMKALQALSNQVTKLLELRNNLSSLETNFAKLIFQKTVFEKISEGVVLQENTGKIIDFNPAATTVLGLSTDQLWGKTSMDPDWNAIRENGNDFPGNEHPAMMALKTGKPQKNVIMGIKTSHSHPRWININSMPLFLTHESLPSHAVTTFVDITEQRSTQQALIQSAKMTSLGEMAGGIAHEINTPLAIITSSSSQAMVYLSEDHYNLEKAKAKIGKIESTANRISQIVKGLRSFSRHSDEDPWENISLLHCIQDAISLCFEKLKNNSVELKLSFSADYIVSAVPTQISQVILNLINNAFDAIVMTQNKWIEISAEKFESNIRIRVIDSGSGIEEKIINKIMQPFFTTKEVGKGTGLGLSISKGIVENFKGKLYYELLNSHTCFVVELPLITEIAKERAV